MFKADEVAPLRGRGLKLLISPNGGSGPRRSLTGAWIETLAAIREMRESLVAPLRGRGLKQPQC